MKELGIEQLLGLDKFEVDDGQAHIVLDKAVCASCGAKPCTWACPARLYVLKDGEISFDYAGCLECGTCRAVCPHGDRAVTWNHPRGGFGVLFRYG